MKSRLYLFYLILVMGMVVLLVRLFELQIILGQRNFEIAEGNRIRKEVIPAPRGTIFDRNDQPLVRNVPVYRIEEPENGKTGGNNNFQIISREEALKIQAKGGVEAQKLKIGVGREYLFGPALAHVLGYLDWEGKGVSGLEEKYNEVLKGKDGGEIYEVDTQGDRVRDIGKAEPVLGTDLHLSIDGELSKTAFQVLEGKKGAIVATEAKTGQVIVLASSPSFDPNLFIKVSIDFHPGGVNIEDILNDPEMPLFNRAIGGIYPPGSTFKIVTAVAGLEEDKIKGDTLINDPGVIKIGDYSYANWYFTMHGGTEGQINVVRAIKRSTDTFFYKVGEYLGVDLLASWAEKFGLGKVSGIDLGGEAAGLVPNPQWKLETKGERWFLGNTYHLAIGQGDLLVTPLQDNLMTAVVANGGLLCKPKLLEMDSDIEGREKSRKSATPGAAQRDSPGVEESCKDLGIKPETLQLVKKGMEEACSAGGTSGIFIDFGIKKENQESQKIEVACKTGTAEFGIAKEKTHAWFTAFAPAEDPQIVVTAVIEGGGEGSAVAAPIVKKVMEGWFKNANVIESKTN